MEEDGGEGGRWRKRSVSDRGHGTEQRREGEKGRDGGRDEGKEQREGGAGSRKGGRGKREEAREAHRSSSVHVISQLPVSACEPTRSAHPDFGKMAKM
eukprot:2267633-Rhodomonas_salina.2